MKVRILLTSLAVAASALIAPFAFAQPTPPPAEMPAPMGVPAPVTPDSEEIQAFSAQVTVNQDGTISVVEQIDYYFTAEKHGIYRDVPTRYDIDGTLVDMPVTVLSVNDTDGQPWQYVVQKNKNSVRIKIGDPDKTISGAHSYVIFYTVSGALRYFDDHDELYWNATGNEWTVPIRKSAAEVILPEGVDKDSVTNKCYTGATGSTAQDCLGRAQGNSVSFVANGPLTVVVGWNKGVVQTLLPKQISFLERNGKYIPFFLPVLVLIALIALWHKHGRDPKGRETIMAQYEPPVGMTPVEVAAISNEAIGNTGISSIIVHMAIRGYLLIAEVEKEGFLAFGKDYEFRKLKDYANDPAVLPYEKDVLDTLFHGGVSTIRVSEIAKGHLFYKAIEPIKSKVFQKLVADGHFPSDPTKVKAKYYGAGIIVLIVLIFFGGSEVISGGFMGNLVIATAISAVIVMIFAPLMSRRTEKGVLAYEHARGFKDYLSTAEKYRMQWQEKENIFEMYLPYAMAFGVVAKWSKAFENMHIPQPQWYQGSSVNGVTAFNSMAFYGAFSSMDKAMGAAMISKPSSSSGGSGSSGGSSGGGGGGGGGGSW